MAKKAYSGIYRRYTSNDLSFVKKIAIVPLGEIISKFLQIPNLSEFQKKLESSEKIGIFGKLKLLKFQSKRHSKHDT